MESTESIVTSIVARAMAKATEEAASITASAEAKARAASIVVIVTARANSTSLAAATRAVLGLPVAQEPDMEQWLAPKAMPSVASLRPVCKLVVLPWSGKLSPSMGT